MNYKTRNKIAHCLTNVGKGTTNEVKITNQLIDCDSEEIQLSAKISNKISSKININNEPHDVLFEKIDLNVFGEYDQIKIWNVDAIVRNYRKLATITLRAHISCGVTLKNGLYGAPLDIVVPRLVEAGCKDIFVASLQEALSLIEALSKPPRNYFNFSNPNHSKNCSENYSDNNVRNNMKDFRIYVLNGIAQGQEKYFDMNNIIPCINTLEELRRWSSYACDVEKTLPCIIHIDTGMHRHGLAENHVDILSHEWSARTKHLEVLYYMSHFYGAKEDCKNVPRGTKRCEEQIALFHELVRNLPLRPVSFSATDSIFALYTCPEKVASFENLVRPGVGLIGGVPSEEFLDELEPVIEMYARVSAIIDVPNETYEPGYLSNKYKFPTTNFNAQSCNNKKIAIINIGYGDGYTSNMVGWYVYINGMRAPVVAVNMNCMMVEYFSTNEEECEAEQSISDASSECNVADKKLALYAEIIGPNVDLRKFALQNECYEIFATLAHANARICISNISGL